MIYLVDTNILLRFSDRSHVAYPIVRTAIRKLLQSNHQLRVTPQNCQEFWNVVTRPANKNGFGLQPSSTDRTLRLIERIFPLFPDDPSIYPLWHQLVVKHGVSGVQVHDTRLVAAMIVHSAQRILTFNIADFVRFASSGIIAEDPANV